MNTPENAKDGGTAPQSAPAEQARNPVGGATPQRDADATHLDSGGTMAIHPHVQSAAGWGVGDGQDNAQAPTIAAAIADLDRLHVDLAALIVSLRRFTPVLGIDASSRVGYFLWRTCEALEKSIGCCPGRRDKRGTHRYCRLCGLWHGPAPQAPRPAAKGGAGPRPGGEGGLQ